MIGRRKRREPERFQAEVAALELSDGGILNVCHPDWRGVRTAAYTFGEPVLEVADAGEPEPLAAAVAASGTRLVVVHAFVPGTEGLLRALHRREVATAAVHYSSPAQHGAGRSESDVIDTLLRLRTEGVLTRLGMAKEGVAEGLAALGHDAAFVPVRPPRVPDFQPLPTDPDRTHVGVFAQAFWRKNVPTQLLAAALIPGSLVHVHRRPDIGYLAGLELVEHDLVDWDRFLPLLAGMDVNLYVTLSECLPLTPMESYQAGVPCLTARTSVLFRSDRELWELTTVDELDNPQAIAAATLRLLEHRGEALARAGRWLERWDEEASARWGEFTRP